MQVNSYEVVTLKVPRYLLDKMTLEEAMQLVMRDAKFQEFVKSWRVIDATLYSGEGCDATIQISTEKSTEESELQETQA